MPLQEFIINDIKPIQTSVKVREVQQLFNQLTYSHVPVVKGEEFIGCISETDVYCFESDKPIEAFLYAIEAFHVSPQTIWLDILEIFAQNDTNIMPVLDQNNNYLGYYELHDIISLFNETPFFSEPGAILIVETGINDYSLSEISQIVESNNAKLFGAFVSRIENDLIQVTLKIGQTGLNEIIQTFRRYSYNIISEHHEDIMMKNLKERSDYLDKYLNL